MIKRSVIVSVMVFFLAGTASAERWLIERGPGKDLPAADAWIPAAAEVLLRHDLSRLAGVTLLSKSDVKSDVVTLELNRLSSATGQTRVTLGKFARARGLIVVDVTGGEQATLLLRVIDLTRPAGEQTFTATLARRNVEQITLRLAERAAAFLGRTPTADERARMQRPTMLTRDALIALGKSAMATSAAERGLFFKLAVQHVERSALAWYLNARELHANGKTLEAISAYRKSITLDADDVACHYDLGNAFFDEKRYAEAAGEYQKAIVLDASHAASHENLIRAQKHLGKKPAEILTPYAEMMGKAYAFVAVAQLQTGRLQWEMGKRAEALAAFHLATDLDGDNPITHFNYAHALEQSGKTNEAIASYRKAIELAPNYAKALNNLARLYEGKGRGTLALFYYQQAVRYAPDYALAWNNLGILYGRRGKHRLEAEAFRKQTKLTPKDPAAWFNLGIAYHRMKSYRAASAAYKKSLALSPDDKLTHWHLALAYERTSTWNLANQHWQKVLSLDPTPDEKQTADKHIAENAGR